MLTQCFAPSPKKTKMVQNVFMYRGGMNSSITSKYGRFLTIGLVLGCLLIASCGGSRKISARTPIVAFGSTEEGVASWYGHPYHGRRSANGEIYDMNKLTAAHPTLPFETWLSVYNFSNRKTTEVRVIDRGPFAKGRIVDLSKAAAAEIDLLRPGITKVRLTVIKPPRAKTAGREYTVQVTSSRDQKQAEQMRQQLSNSYKKVFLRHRMPVASGNSPEGWRVVIGRESTIEKAQEILARVHSRFPNAFVLPWDVE